MNKILEELDRMMDAQEREIEIDMETEDESKVYLETVRLLAYNEVARMIKNVPRKRHLPWTHKWILIVYHQKSITQILVKVKLKN